MGGPGRRSGAPGARLARNVAVAMGNWLAGLDAPPDAALAVSRKSLGDSEPIVRDHAAWALERRFDRVALPAASRWREEPPERAQYSRMVDRAMGFVRHRLVDDR